MEPIIIPCVRPRRVDSLLHGKSSRESSGHRWLSGGLSIRVRVRVEVEVRLRAPMEALDLRQPCVEAFGVFGSRLTFISMGMS